MGSARVGSQATNVIKIVSKGLPYVTFAQNILFSLFFSGRIRWGEGRTLGESTKQVTKKVRVQFSSIVGLPWAIPFALICKQL